jgi:hypothetical protein
VYRKEVFMLANRIATILGAGFLLVGIVGFLAPDLAGMHLSPAHSIVHLVTGAVALWFGLKASPGAAKSFCIVFGAVYLLLGVVGLMLGGAGLPTPPVPGPEDTRLFKVLPGVLELGTMDHSVHILLGGIFFFGGLATRKQS